ncbi:WW domain-containing protein [Rutstroemia sp. NJR-2017a BVV2]|nr:WW domain-containing protein [Rutstroemia sp. NJR-2017a BVV2]
MSTPETEPVMTKAQKSMSTPEEESTSKNNAEQVDENSTTQTLAPSSSEDNATSNEPPLAEAGVATSGNDESWVEKHNGVSEPSNSEGTADAPPLPEEALPPLPDEALPPLPDEQPPAAAEDDGWAPVWDDAHQAFYFYNRFTGATQWDNPRVPEAAQPGPPGVVPADVPGVQTESISRPRPAGGYDPAIHGDYDPNAWYAQSSTADEPAAGPLDPAAAYAATGTFNRFTGRWQAADLNPENFNDENKSKRQMNAFFDVDAAANNHDGRSLKEERSGKKLSKAELKQFKEKRKQKKEEKRRAWLRD